MPDTAWLKDLTLQTPALPRVAVVHEWLDTYAGSERVVREILTLYPDADLFAVVDFLIPEDRAKLFNKQAKTSFIQRLPFASKKFRAYLPLMPIAIEQFDLSAYDLVISSSHAVAKGILTGPDQTHICYCHTPIRYAWDLQHQYLREAGISSGLKSFFARVMLHYIRLWDVRTATGVDQFVANSSYVARRIHKIYGRDAAIIHPPVDIDSFTLVTEKDDFYVTASRMVPYKRMDLIVQAFAQMPDKRLIVLGDGPEMPKLKALAGPNVTLLGYQNDLILRDHLQRARAFVFAAEEDFGIIPVEALACGTPVIAYGRGGALDSVIGYDGGALARPEDAAVAAPTGVFFHEQTAAAITRAIGEFESIQIDPLACRARAEYFAPQRFRTALAALVIAVTDKRHQPS
jgi:glycosyltransferase involved in cell wall biosynthesis